MADQEEEFGVPTHTSLFKREKLLGPVTLKKKFRYNRESPSFKGLKRITPTPRHPSSQVFFIIARYDLRIVIDP